MSENKQNEVLSGYEQLKRRNRRRLVTASCLVAASCILLA
ncbi:cell division protein FtsN, partial [Neisseria meningitidis]|nr:cell division protein FtsN [Neisseria meningitidis]